MIRLLDKTITYNRMMRIEPLEGSGELYGQARSYLVQSSAAAALIYFLEKDPKTIWVTCCRSGLANNFMPEEKVTQFFGDLGGSVVLWNPGAFMTATDKLSSKPVGRLVRNVAEEEAEGEQSPAMGLIHEFGHARQYLLKNVWFMAKFNEAMSDTESDTARNQLEDDNIRTVESVVARQLGEPVRWKYSDPTKMRKSQAAPGYYMNITGDPMLKI
jgi:hypothetical protein